MLRCLFVLMMFCASAASAHEIRPAIGNIEAKGDQLELSLQLSVEALVAEVDLDNLTDTNDSDKADSYDAARALDPDAMAQAVRDMFPRVQEALKITVDGMDQPLTLTDVTVDEVGNVELARDSSLVITAPLPSGATSISVTWPKGYGALILRQQGVEDGFTGFLAPGETTEAIPVSGGVKQSWAGAFAEYIPVGFDHILPKGLDHILFVLGLFFLTPAMRPLLIQISLFTLAHTVTLALGALDIVSIPGSVVEPLIALSIVYVAVENIFTDGLNKWRPFVIFGFGLLHGLGFASVLGDFGLPEGQFIPALIGFNVGVELGQLVVIAVAWAIVLAALRNGGEGDTGRPIAATYVAAAVILVPALAFGLRAVMPDLDFGDLGMLFAAASVLMMFCAGAMVSWDGEAYRRSIAIPASGLIGMIGAWWVIERVLL